MLSSLWTERGDFLDASQEEGPEEDSQEEDHEEEGSQEEVEASGRPGGRDALSSPSHHPGGRVDLACADGASLAGRHFGR